MGNTADPDAYLNSCVKTTEHGFITLSSLSSLLMEGEEEKRRRQSERCWRWAERGKGTDMSFY